MGFAEEEFQIVWKRLMERILSGNLLAKCPFSYIIMEKGGYWVGVYSCCYYFFPKFPCTYFLFHFKCSLFQYHVGGSYTSFKHNDNFSLHFTLIGVVWFWEQVDGKGYI